MFLENESYKERTELVKNLLNHLYELNKQEDIDPNVFELENLGFRLNSIENYKNVVRGTFIKNDDSYKIQIPYYKISEDILEQLKAVMEEYCQFLSEKKLVKFQESYFLDIEMEEIDWDAIYNSKIYGKLSLQTTVELLYEKLYELLSKVNKINENIEI